VDNSAKLGRGSLPHGREGPWAPQLELGRRQAENPNAADFLSAAQRRRSWWQEIGDRDREGRGKGARARATYTQSGREAKSVRAREFTAEDSRWPRSSARRAKQRAVEKRTPTEGAHDPVIQRRA
jgi:hypothetical protein